MKKIVFIGRRLFMKFGNLDYFEKRASEHDLIVVPVESEEKEVLRDAVRDAAALVDIARPVGADIIDAMEQCELILLLSVGYDCVDVACATKHRIPVCNTPAYCTDDVANHAMTLMLALSRKLEIIIPRTVQADWEYGYTKPIFNYKDKVFGIIGLGKIGRAIVPKAKGFGMNVMAYDPYVDDDIFRLLDVERAYELHDLLEQADYVSIHAPLTPETHGMIDEQALAVMKKQSVIVNTARGHIIDEKALFQALNKGSIAGAGLDVLQQEPPKPDEPLLQLDNVIITPHLAWYSEESFVKDMEQGMDELIRVLNGQRPRYIVNPEIFRAKEA